jgi:hypothetical protein
MFTIEIDKFRRMMNIRKARYKHELEENYPFLEIAYGNKSNLLYNDDADQSSELVLRVKEDFLNLPFDTRSIARSISYVLNSDTLSSANKYIDMIYMFEDDQNNPGIRRRTISDVDMLWSQLFKKVPTDGLRTEDIFEKCLKELDRQTYSGPLTLYNGYKRTLNYRESRSGDFNSAILKCNLEIAGQSAIKHICDLRKDHSNIAQHVREILDKRAEEGIWHV